MTIKSQYIAKHFHNHEKGRKYHSHEYIFSTANEAFNFIKESIEGAPTMCTTKKYELWKTEIFSKQSSLVLTDKDIRMTIKYEAKWE